MRREQVISKLKATESAIRALGANALYLYGSHARDEARPDSDVDVFIDKDPNRPFGFDQFMSIYFKLQETLGADIGYTTRQGLVEFYRPDIEREAIRVF
jgi:predicted nucleotidyltransferase